MTKKGAQRTLDLFVFNQAPYTGPLKQFERLGHMNDALSMLLTRSLTCECGTNYNCGDDYDSNLGCAASVCEKPCQSSELSTASINYVGPLSTRWKKKKIQKLERKKSSPLCTSFTVCRSVASSDNLHLTELKSAFATFAFLH